MEAIEVDGSEPGTDRPGEQRRTAGAHAAATGCLVLGASGYIGTLLVPRLLSAGHRVLAASRSAPEGRPSLPSGAVAVRVDVLDPESVRAAMHGVHTVYFLVHSMDEADFVERDRRAARIVAAEAERAGVRQLVYLGGTRPDQVPGAPSDHLASRAEVGDLLLAGPVPALALEASMVIGAGSASFAILGLGAQSPVIPRPGWMSHRSRPIAIDDVLHYLSTAAELHTPVNGAFDISGPDTVSYLELIQRYARVAGLPWRLPVPFPALPAKPTGALVSLISPFTAQIAGSLLDSLRHEMMPADHRVATVIPDPEGGLTSVDQAIRKALGRNGKAMSTPPPESTGPLTGRHVVPSEAAPGELWRVITEIGGDQGWHTLPLVWTARGALDHLFGGIGLHRGRSDRLRAGDTVDFWTVVSRDDERRSLLLHADMKMPGETWLEMSVTEDPATGMASYRQTVTFRPTGLTGRAYWWAQKPAHDLVFLLMARNVVREAERSGDRRTEGSRAR